MISAATRPQRVQRADSCCSAAAARMRSRRRPYSPQAAGSDGAGSTRRANGAAGQRLFAALSQRVFFNKGVWRNRLVVRDPVQPWAGFAGARGLLSPVARRGVPVCIEADQEAYIDTRPGLSSASSDRLARIATRVSRSRRHIPTSSRSTRRARTGSRVGTDAVPALVAGPSAAGLGAGPQAGPAPRMAPHGGGHGG
jgi:hypothetical protein